MTATRGVVASPRDLVEWGLLMAEGYASHDFGFAAH